LVFDKQEVKNNEPGHGILGCPKLKGSMHYGVSQNDSTISINITQGVYEAARKVLNRPYTEGHQGRKQYEVTPYEFVLILEALSQAQ